MKVREFCKKYKKAIKNLIIFLIVALILSALLFMVFYFTGIITISKDSGLAFNMPLFDRIKGEWWSYLLYFLIQVALTVILCFVPGTSMAFIMVGVALWGPTIYTFLLVFAGVLVSSLLMDFIGRFGGVAIIKKLFGEEEYNNGKMMLKEKGIVYLPIMYIFPIFPDDLLCCLAGLTRIKIWYHILIILLCRGVGIFTIVFGLDLIPFSSFTTMTDWIIFILAAAIFFYLVLRVTRMIDIKLSKFMNDKKDKFNKLLMEKNDDTVVVKKSEEPKKEKVTSYELERLDKQWLLILAITCALLALLIFNV